MCFKFNNLTDFEKLLFAERQIKELVEELKKRDKEIGILKSERAELKYLLKKEKPESRKLCEYKKQLKREQELKRKWKREYDKIFEKLLK